MVKIKFCFDDCDPKIFKYETFEDLLTDLNTVLIYYVKSCSSYNILVEKDN